MYRRALTKISLSLVMAIGLLGLSLSFQRYVRTAVSQDGTNADWSPTKRYPSHEVYFPGTEELGPEEMRGYCLRFRDADAKAETGCRLFSDRAR